MGVTLRYIYCLIQIIYNEDEKTLEKYNKYVKEIAKQVSQGMADEDKKELMQMRCQQIFCIKYLKN